jgi:hypothetical protein
MSTLWMTGVDGLQGSRKIVLDFVSRFFSGTKDEYEVREMRHFVG